MVEIEPKDNLDEDTIASSAAYWLMMSNIKLANGEIYSFKNREYLLKPLSENPLRLCYMKATGGGFSEAEIQRTLHGMIYGRFPQGVLYMFPTNDDVQDFSKSRFNTLIANNYSAIGKYVKSGGKGTDTSKLKKVGKAHLYLRGARLDPTDEGTGAKQSTKLSGIQVDRFVADEIDQMDPEAIAKARGRMGNASVDGIKGAHEEVYIANPSDEDRGIDTYWQGSNQYYWFLKCGCGEYTCPIDEFMSSPDRLIGYEGDGRGYLRCRKCGCRIGPTFPGEWVARKPDVRDLVGYHWCHLTSHYHDPARILRDFTNPPEGNLGDVYRLDLGMPYSSREDKLRKEDVLRCCGSDIMAVTHGGPCAMGVDVGKLKHVVIGYRTGKDTYEIIKVAQVDTFTDIHDMAVRYNVRSAVVDIRPYEDEARNFQKAERYKVFLCEYTESPLQEANFNDNTGVVKAFRTGIFDNSHRVIVNGKIKIPRQCPAIEEFVRQCCNCVKVKEEKANKQLIYRYRPTGDGKDHYRNALNYFILAASGSRIITNSGYFERRQKYAIHETVKL